MIFAFAEYELDLDRFELRRAGDTIAIEPQVFDVLHYLVTHRDRVVTKNELLDNVWGDRFVSESALTSRIKAARKALGDDGKTQAVIRTAHGRGYRFALDVAERSTGTSIDDHESGPATPDHTVHSDRGRSDGVHSDHDDHGDHGDHGRSDGDHAERSRHGSDAARVTGDDWPLVGRRAEMERIAGWSSEPERGGVLLVGAAGTGKTRLAEELVTVAERSGLPTARVAGHAEASSIPLAAFAHLVPVEAVEPLRGGELDRATLFHRARAALDRGERRLLLFVDDVDHLDELSRALLASLVTDRAVFALLTMREAPEPSPTVESLVKDGHLERLDIGPLDPDQIETLLHRALGGPVVADTTRQLSDASLGNPGILRQLVESSRAADTLVSTRGVWALTGPLGTTPTLERLVADRLAGLDADEIHATELLAVAGQLGLDVLAGLVGEHRLEELDRRGLLAIRTSGRRHEVRLAHPLYGEILRAGLSTLRARRVRRELADALEAVGARRRDDRIRIVAWRMDAGGHLDPELLVHAARLAILDHDLDVARKLLERAVDTDPSAESVQMLAEIAFRHGESERVEQLLASIDADGLDDHQRARLARRRATNLFFNTMRYEESFALLEAEIGRNSEPAVRATLDAHLAMLLANGGQVARALERARRALPTADGPARLELLRAIGLSEVHAARPFSGLEHARAGQQLHDDMENDVSLPGLSMLMWVDVVARAAAGHVDDARETAHRVKREHPEVVANWIDTAIGRLELMAGRTVEARRALLPVIHDARARGHHTTERWVLALHASARMLEGRADLAEPEMRRVTELEDGGRGLYHSEIDRAHAWYAAARGDLDTAIATARRSADDCRERGAIGMVSALLHDVARFGDPESVASELREIAEVSEGDLFIARALHVEGVVEGSVADLEEAIGRFESGGCTVYAAEAAASLATLFTRLDRPDDAAAAATHSEELRRAGGVRVVTPALPE